MKFSSLIKLVMILAVIQIFCSVTGISAWMSHSLTSTIVESCNRSASCMAHLEQQGGGNPPSIPLPSGISNDYTPSTWATELLSLGGFPETRDNFLVITSWESKEGGHWKNSATFNPLNTTLGETGSHPIPGNSAGVQAYTSWQQGFQATLETLNNGLYSPILSFLRSGNCASCVRDAVANSKWGTGYFSLG